MVRTVYVDVAESNREAVDEFCRSDCSGNVVSLEPQVCPP